MARSKGKRYTIHYVEEDNTEENYPPRTLALTRNSVSKEVLSKLEKMTAKLPVNNFELKYIHGSMKFERIERIEFID